MYSFKPTTQQQHTATTFCRTHYIHMTLFPRTTPAWNNLPQEMVAGLQVLGLFQVQPERLIPPISRSNRGLARAVVTSFLVASSVPVCHPPMPNQTLVFFLARIDVDSGTARTTGSPGTSVFGNCLSEQKVKAMFFQISFDHISSWMWCYSVA